MVSERTVADLKAKLAERDRRIKELDGAIRTFLYGGNIREGEITAKGCNCRYTLESVEALEAALASKGVSRG